MIVYACTSIYTTNYMGNTGTTTFLTCVMEIESIKLAIINNMAWLGTTNPNPYNPIMMLSIRLIGFNTTMMSVNS